PHELQDTIGSGLEGQVQGLTDFLARGQGIDEPWREVQRMRRHKANTLDTVDRIDRRQEIGKVHLPWAHIDAVGVDVLSHQRHFFIPCLRQTTDFLEHHLWRATDLRPACIGHDAERAAFVAAMHDAHKGRNAAVTRHREGPEVIVEYSVSDFEDGLALLLYLAHQVQHATDVQRAKDQVNIRGALQDFPTGTLGNTTTDPDQHIWPLPFETL